MKVETGQRPPRATRCWDRWTAGRSALPSVPEGGTQPSPHLRIGLWPPELSWSPSLVVSHSLCVPRSRSWGTPTVRVFLHHMSKAGGLSSQTCPGSSSPETLSHSRSAVDTAPGDWIERDPRKLLGGAPKLHRWPWVAASLVTNLQSSVVLGHGVVCTPPCTP